jgi:Bacterial protein of unknown function (DUF885)
MDDLHPRLRAVCDLDVAEVREFAGRHEYDGKIQDLSRDGVRAGLARLTAAISSAGRLDDPHDEAHLSVFEQRAQVALGQLELHRRNPLWHLAGLDLSCYDRGYAPWEERDRARREQLAAWPRAIDTAVETLDQVPAPVARALRDAIAGLAAGIPANAGERSRRAALAAHARLLAHIDRAISAGSPDAALGTRQLSALMGSSDGMPVDLGALATRADAERDRLTALLAEGCAVIDPGRPAMQVVRDLVRDHPDINGVIEAARRWTAVAIEFTRDADLVPYQDGECKVGLAPPSRRWATAMMSAAAPGEPDAPSWYHITPPDPAWPAREIEEWLEVFSETTLPAITVHEVAPGHFSHSRALRRAPTEVRQILQSGAFIEGWAHYAEELCVEQGFLAGSPRFAIGVWLDALVRVVRLTCAIGVHSEGMTVAEAARMFETYTHLSGRAALSEARRATFDPTYGRYTWGKLQIMDLRERARKEWGTGFSLPRFHAAMLTLGSPPLGLLGTAVERG